jgi:hypothetical protein
MPAIRSLIVLIALLATGVSANLLRFAGVGLGNSACELAAPLRENPNVLRSDGIGEVRLPVFISREAQKPVARATASPIDTPAIRRIAPRTFSLMFISFPPGIRLSPVN